MQYQLKIKVMTLIFKQPIQLDKDTQSDVKPRLSPKIYLQMWRILSSPARETPDTLSHLEKRTDDSPPLRCFLQSVTFDIGLISLGTKEPSAEQQPLHNTPSADQLDGHIVLACQCEANCSLHSSQPTRKVHSIRCGNENSLRRCPAESITASDSILQSSSSRNIGDRHIRTESYGLLNFDAAFAKISEKTRENWLRAYKIAYLEEGSALIAGGQPFTVAVTSATLRPVIKAHINSSAWRGLLVENGGIFMCSRV
eukprot:Em0004g1318a